MTLLRKIKRVTIIFPFCFLGFTDFPPLHSPNAGLQSLHLTVHAVHFLSQHPFDQHKVQSVEEVEYLEYEPVGDLQGSERHRNDHQQNPVVPEEDIQKSLLQ